MKRNEENYSDVVKAIADRISLFVNKTPKQLSATGTESLELASKLFWDKLISFYEQAWNSALQKLEGRADQFEMKRHTETLRNFDFRKQDQANWKKVLIQPVYTPELEKLNELTRTFGGHGITRPSPFLNPLILRHGKKRRKTPFHSWKGSQKTDGNPGKATRIS